MVRSCLAVVTAALVLAPAAHAADVRVVNERGLPQSALWTDDAQDPRYLTDADGWIKEVAPGATLRVTRSLSTQPCYRNPGGAPEGPAGVTFTVPESGGGTIVLPNATGPSFQAEPDEAERWIVGQINARRAQNGKPALRISAILTQAASAVAHQQAARSLSFPPPFCPVVVADWGYPGRHAYSIAGLDANGTDPRKAWAHWSDGSIRETSGTLGGWTAVGVSGGGGAWAAYFANCPPELEVQCKLTTDQGDATIVLPEPQPQAPSGPPAGEAPALGDLTVAPRQRGRAVRLTVGVGRAGTSVAVRLKRGTRILGKVLRRDAPAGKLPLKVALNHSGKKLLRAKRTLSITVEVVVDPAAGASASATRKVRLRG